MNFGAGLNSIHTVNISLSRHKRQAAIGVHELRQKLGHGMIGREILGRGIKPSLFLPMPLQNLRGNLLPQTAKAGSTTKTAKTVNLHDKSGHPG